MPRKPPPANDYVGLTNYRKRSVPVEDLFNRAKRMLYEQLGRAEQDMFIDAKKGFDPARARLVKELAAAVTSLGQMYLKIEEKARAATDAMTTGEKIDTVCAMVLDEGRLNRMKWHRGLTKVLYHIENPEVPYGETDDQDSPGAPEYGD